MGAAHLNHIRSPRPDGHPLHRHALPWPHTSLRSSCKISVPAHGLIATYVLLKVLRCASHSLTFHTTSFSWSCSFPEVSLLHYNDASLYEGSSKRKCTKKHRETDIISRKILKTITDTPCRCPTIRIGRPNRSIVWTPRRRKDAPGYVPTDQCS